jgi:hypothetical protein
LRQLAFSDSQCENRQKNHFEGSIFFWGLNEREVWNGKKHAWDVQDEGIENGKREIGRRGR